MRDNYFSPDAFSVKRGTKVVWRWPKIPGDVHDVYLARKPDGVRRFRSEYASSDHSFARRLRKPGRYRMVCTLHEEMSMRVRVRR